MLLLWHSLATGKGKLFCMLCINRSHFQSENNLVVVANCACPLLSIHSNLRNQLDMDWYCFKIILYMKMKEIFDSLLHKKKLSFSFKSYHMYVMNWIFFKTKNHSVRYLIISSMYVIILIVDYIGNHLYLYNSNINWHFVDNKNMISIFHFLGL